jgi:predicted metal-dependent HD superfamily phosphohydrolase
MVKTHNLETNEVTNREMNDVEFAQWEADQVAETARIAAEEAKAAEKTAILARLGLTADELKTILGVN